MLFSLVIFMLVAMVLTLLSTHIYKSFATKRDFVAQIKTRSLHDSMKPEGSGIVFSLIFILLILLISWFSYFNNEKIIISILVGSLAATLYGFFDDIFDFRALNKLFVQILLASWMLWLFSGGPLAQYATPLWISQPVSIFVIVWIINLFNFMDGIDGLAASGSIFICLTLGSIVLLTNGNIDTVYLFFILSMVLIGFLAFNFPPASVFMGDAGSLFLGYTICILSLKITMENDVSIWTICIISGYFLTDTTTTTVIRLMKLKNWYGEHKSHAYQNLARIWKSHKKVTTYIIFYHLIWLSPLAVMSVIFPTLSPFLFLIAVAPVIYLTILFGPYFSSD